jgi:hypothetical protein
LVLLSVRISTFASDVGVTVGVAVDVEVGVTVGVWVAVKVGVIVGVRVACGVAVLVAVGVGVLVGCTAEHTIPKRFAPVVTICRKQPLALIRAA